MWWTPWFQARARGAIYRFNALGAGVPVELSRSPSSHGWGVAEALALGQVLHELPPWLIIYGIEGQNFGPGQEVSQEVAAAIPEAARRIRREIQMWLGRDPPQKRRAVLMNLTEKIAGIFPAETDIPEFYRLDNPVDQEEYLVNGELRRWSGPMQEVRSPVYVKTAGGLTQKVVGRYPLLGEPEALEALAAAVKAYDHGHGPWPSMSVQDRISHLEDFIFRIIARKDEVVKTLMWEIGKPYGDSAKEFDRTVAYIRATIDALKDLDRTSSRFVMEQGIFGQIRRAPLGVVLCMGPFNYPLNETYTSVIPALIMGNTVIFKPPKLGVLLHSPFLAAFQESLPPGVINTVYGRGAQVVGPLMASGQVDVLAFIGTSKVADILKKQHPKPHRLRAALGLEAKNPAIIMPDADLDLTVAECLLGALSFNGQRCTALKLLFVHREILPQFLEKFTAGPEWAEIRYALGGGGNGDAASRVQPPGLFDRTGGGRQSQGGPGGERVRRRGQSELFLSGHPLPGG